MNIFQDELLVIAAAESKRIISNSLSDIPELKMIEADSESKAFELIYSHFFVLVILDETLPHIDKYKIGAMLLSHKKTHNPPLLIITDTIRPENFLLDFKALQIDYMLKPFDEQLIRAKLILFYDLFKQKNAVSQSIDELDKVYKKIVEQHELGIKEELSKKELANISSIAANQMLQPLQSLQGTIYQLLRTRDISPKTKSSLATMKTAVERLAQITKKMFAFPGKAKKILFDRMPGSTEDPLYKILYVENSDEDFSIINHLLKSVIKCRMVQAKTLEQGFDLIAGGRFDLIFIDPFLSDGTGFDLLTKLKQMRSDIPVVFALDKPHIDLGPKAVSKGAFTYFVKEEFSSGIILSIIHGTLRKARITREVEDAQNRIVMISRKDMLTKLFNRRCFEQELDSETSKAARYNIPLSILMMDFDQFDSITETHGYDMGDAVLTTSASIVQSMVRNNDVVCRYGGQEFGIVLPNTALTGARILAQRIKNEIAGHRFKNNTIPLTLTVSIGVASFVPETDRHFSTFVKKALDALANATEQGGNRVETSTL